MIKNKLLKLFTKGVLNLKNNMLKFIFLLSTLYMILYHKIVYLSSLKKHLKLKKKNLLKDNNNFVELSNSYIFANFDYYKERDQKIRVCGFL